MPQFDVHRNPGRRTGRTHPFLVIVQSDRWSTLGSRLVVPLVLRVLVPVDAIARSTLTPVFTVERREVFLNPFDLVSVPLDQLGPPVTSFATDDAAKRRIQQALDNALNPG